MTTALFNDVTRSLTTGALTHTAGARPAVDTDIAPASARPRAGDGATLTGGKTAGVLRFAARTDRIEQLGLEAAQASAGLEKVSSLLEELRGLVKESRSGAQASEGEVQQRQARVDEIIADIRGAEPTGRVKATLPIKGQGASIPGGYFLSNVNYDVKSTNFRRLDLFALESLQVDAVVTQSAQVGGFFLSFGGSSIDLASPASQFTVEIAGAKGSRTLSFASGTSLASIRNAINSYTQFTGVQARVSGTTGLRLQSEKYGTDGYVSVKVSNAGGLDSGNRGLYNFSAGDADAVSTAGRVSTFAGAANPVFDFGQNIRANVNGVLATGKGTMLKVVSDFYDLDVDLAYNRFSTGGSAAKLGSLTMFTINRFPTLPPVQSGYESNTVQATPPTEPGDSASQNGPEPRSFSLESFASGGVFSLSRGVNSTDTALSLIDSAAEQVRSLRADLDERAAPALAESARREARLFASDAALPDSAATARASASTARSAIVSQAAVGAGFVNPAASSVLRLLGSV